MGNESQHSWVTVSVPSMGALKYTTHLLPLFRLLLFIINARNKCVMLVLAIIDMEWRSHVIFDSSAAPLFMLSSLRLGRNKIVCCFVFRVRHIYCGMTSCLPCASVRLGCPRHVSFPWFSRTRSPIHFVLFPPFLFVFVQFSSSFVAFHMHRSPLSTWPFLLSSLFF